MHDLSTVTALRGTEPRVDALNYITITENDGLALAAVTARLGQEDACKALIKDLLGAVPSPDKVQMQNPEAGFWIGPNQWMVRAPKATHELLADVLKDRFRPTASITEQSGACATFDVQGHVMEDLCELICNIRFRRVGAGEARRTVMHQFGCIVTRREAADHVRVLGPLASAGILHHAVVTAVAPAAE